MRLSTVLTNSGSRPAVEVPGVGWVLTEMLVPGRRRDIMQHLNDDDLEDLRAATTVQGPVTPVRDVVFDAPYRSPRKIVGIGLNYRSHATDLGAEPPRDSPVSFIKGDHTIIGPGDPIVLPEGVGRVTAEAELGLIFGRRCHKVPEQEAMSYIAGVCAVLDQTAEDVLRQNPRFLGRSKNYPTFFSFGPTVVTLDEVQARVGDLSGIRIRTLLNGAEAHADTVANMMFSPAELVSFHSHVMPFFPGDVLSTGTPGAVAVQQGDIVACEIEGLDLLSNPVR